MHQAERFSAANSLLCKLVLLLIAALASGLVHDPFRCSIHSDFYRSMVCIGANRQTNRGFRCRE